METSNLAGFAVLVSFLSFILGTIIVIVFFVMASNVGTITRVIKAMRSEQMNMASSLNKMAGTESAHDKARRFDEAIEAAKKREQAKI